MITIEQAGIIARDAAIAAWQRHVIEPRKRGEHPESATWIDSIIRTPAGLDWSWVADTFDRDGEYEWCGAFAAHAWSHAGLDLDLRRLYYSSTSRLAVHAIYQPHFGTPNEREIMARFPRPTNPDARRVRILLDERSTFDSLGDFIPRAGDILLVGTIGSRMGTHVCLVDEWDPVQRIAHTIEGNARGTFPDGRNTAAITRGDQGVVRQRRPLGARAGYPYHIRRIIRPSIHDLTIQGASS